MYLIKSEYDLGLSNNLYTTKENAEKNAIDAFNDLCIDMDFSEYKKIGLIQYVKMNVVE